MSTRKIQIPGASALTGAATGAVQATTETVQQTTESLPRGIISTDGAVSELIPLIPQEILDEIAAKDARIAELESLVNVQVAPQINTNQQQAPAQPPKKQQWVETPNGMELR